MSSLQQSHNRKKPLAPVEIIILFLTIFSTAVSAWWVHHLGLTTSLTDASAHLDFSKFLSQSLTPGISQIGFWPPLLQLVMAPWAAIPYLFKTGLAGYFAILPFFCLGVLSFYRLIKNLTGRQSIGVTAIVLLLLNPYVLYYASVPMMEMLYLSNLLVASYALVRWLQSHEMRHLIWLGVFVTLTSMSRYEGLLLIPLIGLILVYDLYRNKTNRSQTEATLLLFGMVAIVGAVFIATYSWVFGGSPLAFNDTSWIRDPESNLGITKHHLATTIKYLASGAYYMVGKPLAWLALATAVLSLISKRMRFERLAALLCLISPIIFVAAALFAGSDSVLTPNLFPFKFFHNDRYTLTWIGFVITSPLLLISDILSYGSRIRWTRPLAIGFASLALVSLISYSAFRTYSIAYAGEATYAGVERYQTITLNINGAIDPQRADQEAIGQYLNSSYDFGYVLLLRSNEDPIVQTAGIPLDHYIYEANYRYYTQALTDPEIFARWVITTNTSDSFSSANDKVSTTLEGNGTLKKYYTLVYKTDTRQVYEINQTAALQEAIGRGYNAQLIPSIVSSASALTWDPTNVYTALAAATNTVHLSSDKIALSAALQTIYDNQLRSQFTTGVYVDSKGKGSSEDQAYAMEEALAADDPTTFATVWKWTQSNLQRPDKLISYQFTQGSDNSIKIDDPNSATSADTDIALVLLKAGNQWKETSYTTSGQQMVQAIWNGDTEYDSAGNRHVLAGNWGRLTVGFITNAQAIDPAAYHTFATVDPTHNWGRVADHAYVDLTAMSTPSFTGHEQFMPINWAIINPTDGSLSQYKDEAGYDDISYGSMRAIWYAAQDYDQFKTPAAKVYLTKLTTLQQGIGNGKLLAVYTYDANGKLNDSYVDAASLAAPISALQAINPPLAQQVVANYALHRENLAMPSKSDFFQQSWYWLTLTAWSKR